MKTDYKKLIQVIVNSYLGQFTVGEVVKCVIAVTDEEDTVNLRVKVRAHMGRLGATKVPGYRPFWEYRRNM